MLSVNCIATTTDFTADTSIQVMGGGIQVKAESRERPLQWGCIIEAGFWVFLIKYWNNKYMEEFGLSQCYWLVA